MIRSFTKFSFLFLFLLATMRLNAQSVGGVTSGAATYCSASNTGFISLTAFTGSILNWESSTDGGATWTTIANVTSSQSYFGLTQTTCYRAIVQDGAFPPDTSTISCITVYLPSVGGTITGGGTFCLSSGPGTLTLTGNNGGVLYWQFSTDGGATWTTIPDTNTTITYPSITVNTLFWAVVQNGPPCPTDTSSQASFVIVSPSAGGTAAPNDTVCYLANSGTINLSGSSGPITSWIFSTDGGLTWGPIADTDTSITYTGLTQSTLYAAITQNTPCSPDTSTFAMIIVLPPPTVSAGLDSTIAPGDTVVLNGSGSGAPVWTPSTGLDNPLIFNPTATPTITTTYVLTVTDPFGCTNSDNVIITVVSPEFDGMISNLFTPNGDGINDMWFIQDIVNYPENEVFVFNIYGQQVFAKQGYMNDWEGTYNGNALPDGTYYYVLKFNDSEIVMKGSLDILRNK